MKIKYVIFAVFILFVFFQTAPGNSESNPGDMSDSCTSIMVGKQASSDGSVITSHTCDANYRTWVDVVPAKDHKPGEQCEIYKGLLHTGYSTDSKGLKVLGKIPQVSHTFKYFNTAYPAMNEFQLMMGESTFGGKKELKSDRGIFQIEELQRIALQRTRTARKAIQLMGYLIKKYGYCDYGEALTIADKDEVWQFEVVGPGKGRLGGIWTAKRIPDDHVSVAANISRIGEIEKNNPNFFMYSKNVIKQAVKLKLYDKKKDGKFKFWKAYGASYSKKPFSIREFWILSKLAPSLGLKYESEELPFSVKPEKKVSLKKVMELYRTTYVGTEYDMRKNLLVEKKYKENGKEMVKKIISPIATPWMSRDLRKLLNTLKKDSVKRYRPVAVEYCAYHTILQARKWLPDEIGGIMWLGFDNPALTPKFPVYSGMDELNERLKIGSQHRFTLDSPAWIFRRASKLAQGRWDKAKKEIVKTMKYFEEKMLDESLKIEKEALNFIKKDPETAKKLLSDFSDNSLRSMLDKYRELGNKFWMFYRFRMR